MKKWLKKYADVISYLFFGVLTTAVNYLIYLPCYNLLSWSAGFSNIVAWSGAVAFAFLTNKPFVFGSHDWSARTVIPEFVSFVSCVLFRFIRRVEVHVLTERVIQTHP